MVSILSARRENMWKRHAVLWSCSRCEDEDKMICFAVCNEREESEVARREGGEK